MSARMWMVILESQTMRRFPGESKGLVLFFLVTRMESLSRRKVFIVFVGIRWAGVLRSVVMMLWSFGFSF